MLKIVAAFVISNILGSDVRNPQFNAKRVNQKLNSLFDVAVKFFLK